MRIISANVNGIRSAYKKGFYEYLAASGADIVCVQELKAQETDLLAEILSGYEFDVVQQQALVQAVIQQSRFDPDAFHQEFDDEDVTGICPHCINPPMPPLRDYLVWRQTLAKQAT